MGRGRFTKEEIRELRENPYVSAVSETRIIYTNEFKHKFVEEYMNGRKPTEIFREAGFDVKALGSKRIERACARWKESFYAGTLGMYECVPPEEGADADEMPRSGSGDKDSGDNVYRGVIEDQMKIIRELRNELEQLKTARGGITRKDDGSSRFERQEAIMRKHGVRRRAISLLMTFVLIFTMMPATTLTAGAATDGQDRQQERVAEDNAKEGGVTDGSAEVADADVVVEWMPEKETVPYGEDGVVDVHAALNEESPADGAEVRIYLTDEEFSFLKDMTLKTDEDKTADAGEAADSDAVKDDDEILTTAAGEDGSRYISIALDGKVPEVNAVLTFGEGEETSLLSDVEIDVTDDDIAALAAADDGGNAADEDAALTVDKETKAFLLKAAEKEKKEEKKAVKQKAAAAAALPDSTEVAIDDWREAFSQTIYWADNNNETGIRPAGSGDDAYPQPVLSFTMTKLGEDGNQVGNPTASEKLTADNIDKVGLDAMPVFDVNYNYGVGTYLITMGGSSLPSKVTYTDMYGDEVTYEVNWTITPPKVDGYDLTEVTEENLNEYTSVSEPGWYYTLLDEFTFDVQIRWGDLGSAAGITDATLGHLDFIVDIEGQDERSMGTLLQLEKEGVLEIETAADQDNPTSGTVTISNTWKYNLDGTLIQYSIMEDADGQGAEPDGKIYLEEGVLDEGDYFNMTYDNTAAPNYGSVTDRIHNGGKLYLTLTGATEYEAHKVWLDEGSAVTSSILGRIAAFFGGDETKRPTGEFQLWRYRKGESPSTAAPVRYTVSVDASGKPVEGHEIGDIVIIEINGEDEQEIIFNDADGAINGIVGLDKYDQEGYEYIYVVREFLDSETGDGDTADNYEQVFGAVSLDGDGNESISDMRPDKNGEVKESNTERKDATDRFLYNGGTLSNRITGTVPTEVEKVWKAAAFQADFEDVDVELTLYEREKDSNGEWIPAKGSDGENIVVEMTDFTAEKLTIAETLKVDKYNALGKELEYKWIETGVFQNEVEVELSDAGTGSDEEKSFTLTQDGREVEYSSVTEVETDGDGNGNDVSVVTNSIANTIDFDLKKTWLDKGGNVTEAPDGAEVEFGLYRISGTGKLADQDPILTFVMDGEPGIDESDIEFSEDLLPENHGIEVTEGEDWTALVSPLPEFDEDGRQYEYVMLEQEGPKGYYVSSYETTRTEDFGYHMEAVNAPGEGNRILVRKEWVDDSDTMHREPVKIEVRARADDEVINTVTLGAVETTGTGGASSSVDAAGEEIWQKLVGIDDYKPEEVYIVEVEMGDNEVSDPKIDADGEDAVPEKGDAKDFFYSGVDDDEYATAQCETTNHKYEVSYIAPTTVGADTMYSVQNRRLGTIDVTVSKDWVDGDDSLREEIEAKVGEINDAANGTKEEEIHLVARLDFADENVPDYYEITYNGYADGESDTVTIGSPELTTIKTVDRNNPDDQVDAASIQDIPLEDSAAVAFYGLPKYDRGGKTVRYTVEEMWVDGTGKELKLSNIKEKYPALYDLISEYGIYYEETYNVEDLHDQDQHGIDIQNKLTGTKDVMWHKQWNDQYNHDSNQRPDIYLDIYRVVHERNDSGDVVPKTELYQANYKWVYVEADEDAGLPDDHLVSKQYHWHAQFENLPKYDDYGYEIMYYAVEKTLVNKGEFDYMNTIYSTDDPNARNTNGLVTIGTEYELEESASDAVKEGLVLDVSDLEGSGTTGAHYALVESGTFTNTIENNVTIQGQKLWASLPSGYPNVDLPTATFTLYQILDSDKGKLEQTGGIEEKPWKGPSGTTYETKDGDPVATITVSDWADIYKNGSYIFQLKYTGKNTITNAGTTPGETTVTGAEGASELPKYDDIGRLYNYSLAETEIEFKGDTPDNTWVYSQPVVNTYLIKNTYESKKADISVKKYLELPMDEKGEPEAFPAVRFELTRTYAVNDQTEAGSDPKMSEPEIVDYKVWSSADVKAAYEAMKDSGDQTGEPGSEANPVMGTVTFENLAVYAPNGSKYVYQVREVKDYLGGYETWAVAGDEEEPAKVKQNENLKNNDDDASVGGISLSQYLDKNTGDRLDNDKAPVVATFLNAPDKNRETVTIEGEKIWDDYNNAFGLRPEGITLTLYRYADQQGNQDNPIKETEVPVNDYEISWNYEDPSYTYKMTADSWKYTITGKVTGELEKYAPNGMPWRYVVRELDSKNQWNVAEDGEVIYNVSPHREESDGKDGGVVRYNKIDENGNITMNSLTNSITRNVPYSKSWVDSEGNIITDDYMGLGKLNVNFELQVAEQTDGERKWKPAADYFGDHDVMPEEEYKAVFGDYDFKPSISGAIDDSEIWGVGNRKLMEDLPIVIKKGTDPNAEPVRLLYRIVETSIEYDGGKQDITVNEGETDRTYTYEFGDGVFEPAYYPDGRGVNGDGTVTGEKGYNKDTTCDHYNRLATTGLTVTKEWEGDNENIYGTRPDSDRTGYTWETAFVIQYTTEKEPQEDDWTNVQVYDGGNTDNAKDLVVYLYGTNDDKSVLQEISGLPTSDASGKEYTYRALELAVDPGRYADGNVEEDNILDKGDPYNEAYNVSYDIGKAATTATNTLQDTKVYAEKVWHGTPADSLTLELQYKAADGSWKSFSPKATVALDGEADAAHKAPYYEYADTSGAWKAVWEDLPERLAGSDLTSDKTVYRVVETVPNGYMQFGDPVKENAQIDGKYPVTTFTNVKTTSVTVTKNWSVENNNERQDVAVGLYRTTKPESRPEPDMDPVTYGDIDSTAGAAGDQVTATLSSPNWKHTFSGLPAFDKDGNKYHYYVREEFVGAQDVENTDFIVVNEDGQTGDAYSTDIRNIGRTELSGTKTWVDNGDAYGTRPDSLKLKLERKTESGDWREVDADIIKAEGIELTWTGTYTNEWSYQYTDLPYSDDDGNRYQYRASEIVPDVEKGGGTSGDEYIAKSDGNDFTNTLADDIDVTVTKIWDDSDDLNGTRPDEITLVLYADGTPVENGSVTLKAEDYRGSEWSHTFTNLPEYDDTGKRIEYTVKEEGSPDVYAVTYGGKGTPEEGLTVTNTAEGALEVTKTVGGNDGDKGKSFNFTVELSDSSVTGVYGDMEFENGVAEFTLKDGETAEAEGLPGNIAYEVTEKEADKGGYVTESENAEGTVPAGDTADVSFVNTKDLPGSGTKTGDDSDIMPWIALMTLAMAGMAGAAVFGRRRGRR